MQKILIIGGTGIVGTALACEALRQGYKVSVVGLERSDLLSEEVEQIILDRRIDSLENLREISWDVVVDAISFSKEDAAQTYELFRNSAKHIFILSTVLVYDRSKSYELPLKSSHPLAKRGELGGYVDHKLDVEHFWQSITDASWTILRPYHILGGGDSFLGCIPNHNRDPKLISSILENKSITLCERGAISFNFVNPLDIARVILKAAGNPKTFSKSYNAVNPEEIFALDYYKLIAQCLGRELSVENISLGPVWEEDKGWQLTALPHLYDVSDLKRDVGVVPGISLRETIQSIIKNFKPEQKNISDIPVHQRMTCLPRPRKPDWLV